MRRAGRFLGRKTDGVQRAVCSSRLDGNSRAEVPSKWPQRKASSEEGELRSSLTRGSLLSIELTKTKTHPVWCVVMTWVRRRL
ncbi:hypothetical protein RSAG8_04132, partial [Rhizoctonia solani AG-8 WAC10335]